MRVVIERRGEFGQIKETYLNVRHWYETPTFLGIKAEEVVSLIPLKDIIAVRTYAKDGGFLDDLARFNCEGDVDESDMG